MIRAAALGLTLVVTILLTGCGLLAVDKPPDGELQLAAPALAQTFPEVDALAPATPRTLSLPRARRLARRAALQIAIPACDDDPAGRGFAIDARTLVAHRDVLDGGGWVRVWTSNRRSSAVGPGRAFRAGELALVQVARPVPRRLPVARSVAVGASVVAVVERNEKLRMLPGVVVDSVSGEPYGARTKVLRLTSPVREGDAGPVLDAKGRIVAVVFAVDELTTLGLAVPISALRGRAPERTLEALDACD